MSTIVKEFINDYNPAYWIDTKNDGRISYWGAFIFSTKKRFGTHKNEESIKSNKNGNSHYQMLRNNGTLLTEGISIAVDNINEDITQIKLKPESSLHRFIHNVKIPYIDKITSHPL